MMKKANIFGVEARAGVQSIQPCTPGEDSKIS